MSVIVANPGAISWMLEAARAFAEHDELECYMAPVAVSEREVQRLSRSRLLPAAVRRKLVAELQKRAASGVVGDRVQRAATSVELMHVLLGRSGLPLRARRSMFRRRMESFDRGVSRRLRPGLGGVIGYHGSAVATFTRAGELAVPAVLDYPAGHFKVVQPIYEEEAELVPEFAPTLVPGYPAWQRERYEREIELADRIIVLSSYGRRTFEQAGVDPAKIAIAPLGVDLELFTAAERPPDGPFRVVFCGVIGQHKGISYLLDGFEKADLGPDAELIFIGHSIEPEIWNSRPGVRHLPLMPRRKLPEVFRTCHAIALPSLSEGFGAAPLEGMACGLPAIVSERTFADDVIEDGVDGWVVPIRDSDAIAEKLQQLHDDRQLQQRMSTAARAKAEQFPWRRYREALYQGVMSARDRAVGREG